MRGPPESPCERFYILVKRAEIRGGDYIASAGSLDTAIALSDDTVDSIAVLVRDGLHLEVLEDAGDPT